MSEKMTCKSCAAYCVQHPAARQGSCRARSPQAIMVGVQNQAVPMLGAMNGRKMSTPIVNGFFPPVAETCWCAEWRPNDGAVLIEAEAIEVGETEGAAA